MRISSGENLQKKTLTGGITDAERDDAIGHLGILLEVGRAATANLGEEISASKLGEVGVALDAGHGEGRGRLLGRLLGSHEGRGGTDEEGGDGELHSFRCLMFEADGAEGAIAATAGGRAKNAAMMVRMLSRIRRPAKHVSSDDGKSILLQFSV